MNLDEQTYDKSFDLSYWKRLAPFVRGVARYLIPLVVTMLAAAGVDVVIPMFQRYAIDNFIVRGTMAGLGGFLAKYAGVILANRPA